MYHIFCVLTYQIFLHFQGVAIHGWSGDCQSNSGVWGYSDMGEGYRSGNPRKLPRCAGYSDIGGYRSGTIHGWSVDCQSNSGVRGYSDMGGGGIAVVIHGWSGDCQSNSGVRGYSDIGGYRSGIIHVLPWTRGTHIMREFL